MTLRVIAPGALATVQDLGRDGRAALGIARSGALDRGALRLANRLVGNPEGAAAVELTVGGFRALADTDLWVALSGARGDVSVGGRAVDSHTPMLWPAGRELEVGVFSTGVRAYLAVRGGLDTPLWAGSRATDTLAGLGRPALRPGDVLPVGPVPHDPVPAIGGVPWRMRSDGPIEVQLAPGPRADWFAASALPLLFETVWTIGSDADRVGLRLDGPELLRARGGELPSEGMVPGALQVPPSGRPTILLADGPVTGGYPVIAVATDASLDALGQARPGGRLRFSHARPPV
ncbi:biotin-dependent carboxyltransferase family protein [Microbacterium sp. P06]|uniref:5-oxoprolinase subunit C family protein n=1 Tax=unclassified Microbacterium TaxID=2609290 RepID=UPI0037477FB4